jgi:hypothetical protein
MAKHLFIPAANVTYKGAAKGLIPCGTFGFVLQLFYLLETEMDAKFEA